MMDHTRRALLLAGLAPPLAAAAGGPPAPVLELLSGYGGMYLIPKNKE